MRNFSPKSRSERSKDFGNRRGKDSGRPTMHHAICNNCGKDCEVPFKPTGGKPIYCSNCFEKSQNDGPKKYGQERNERNFKGGDSRKRSYDDRDSVVHKAVCDNCGIDCEVPFRPTKGKPIYCDKCFGNTKEKDTDQLKKELEVLNKKLDKILEILTPAPAVKNYKEELDEETEVPKLKKVTKKKVATKKELDGETEVPKLKKVTKKKAATKKELDEETEVPKLKKVTKKKVATKKELGEETEVPKLKKVTKKKAATKKELDEETEVPKPKKVTKKKVATKKELGEETEVPKLKKVTKKKVATKKE